MSIPLQKQRHVRNHGVADRRLAYLNSILLDPDSGPDAAILQTTHTSGTGRLVLHQPSTGKTEYLDLPGSEGAWGGVCQGEDVYLGGHHPRNFYHLHWPSRRLKRIPLPDDGGYPHSFVHTVDFGSDGRVYMGTYPDCSLLSYDPDSGEVRYLGVMMENENYLRNVCGKFPGKIYCGIGAHAQLVDYDIPTDTRTAFLPAAFQDRSHLYYIDRFRDLVFAVVTPNDAAILFFDPETHEVVRDVRVPEGAVGFWVSSRQSMVATDQGVYFGTTPDDGLHFYDFDADRVTRTADGLGIPFGLARDRYLFCKSYFGTYSVFDLEASEVVLQSGTNFEGEGMAVFALGEGPEGSVMGGAYINQSFFVYDNRKDELKSLGASVSFGGQIRNVLLRDDKMYLAHYTHARLSVYDPGAPWKPGMWPDANPRVIGAVEHFQDRIPGMYLAEDGNIYLGTIPEYGHLGGALAVFDPIAENFEVYRNIVPDQSVVALAGDGAGRVFGGSDIRGGLGIPPSEQEGRLFVWDMQERKKTADIVPVPGATGVRGVVWSQASERVIGAADSAVFVFDPRTGQVDTVEDLEQGSILTLLLSRDGWVYGVTAQLLFRIGVALDSFQELHHAADAAFGHALVETRDDRLFSSIGAELCELIRE